MGDATMNDRRPRTPVRKRFPSEREGGRRSGQKANIWRRKRHNRGTLHRKPFSHNGCRGRMGFNMPRGGRR
jgi:hypothetical protein